MEIAIEDGNPKVEVLGGADTALDGANQDEQEPSEGDAAVHIAQTPVLFGDAQVEQALLEHLPNGGQQFSRKDIFPDDGTLEAVKLAYPAHEFINTDREEGYRTQHKRQYERMKVLHYAKISVVLDKIWRILIIKDRRLTPRGQTSMHLPQSMHFWSSSSKRSY